MVITKQADDESWHSEVDLGFLKFRCFCSPVRSRGFQWVGLQIAAGFSSARSSQNSYPQSSTVGFRQLQINLPSHGTSALGP